MLREVYVYVCVLIKLQSSSYFNGIYMNSIYMVENVSFL